VDLFTEEMKNTTDGESVFEASQWCRNTVSWMCQETRLGSSKQNAQL